MDLTTLVLFSISITLLSLIPGPSVLLVLMQTTSKSTTSGVIAMLGVTLGAIIFYSMAFFGIDVLMKQEGLQNTYYVIQLISAGYVGWLGLNLLRSEVKRELISTVGTTSKEFLSGLSVAIGNPKSLVFYVSILPSFIELKSASLTTFFVYLFIVGVSTALVLSLYIILGAIIRKNILSKKFDLWSKKIAGGFFILLSIYVTMNTIF